MEWALLVNNNRDLWAIDNLFGTYREYIFWRTLQYISFFWLLFHTFDDKQLLDITRINK